MIRIMSMPALRGPLLDKATVHVGTEFGERELNRGEFRSGAGEMTRASKSEIGAE
jgi:hypothetical protein